MKKVEECTSLEQAPGTAPDSPFARRWWEALDDLLFQLGDRLNPILVKETRQALKSRQFTASFWLVLLFAAGWSFIGISILMPRVYYMPAGRFMLGGYFFILCVPLLLVVPFSAFRSLAAEREDGTYELLSITTLSSGRIVMGKLGSALMQMLVYYAALAPCIAFTYLLRGLDIGSIAVLLVGTFLVSVLFSGIGLVFAGAAKSRQWQALTSVVLLLLLIPGSFFWGFWMMMAVYESVLRLNSLETWCVIGFTLTIYATFLALILLVAAAQNAFASDNRSTRIRIVLLVQTVLFTAWMVFFWVWTAQEEFAVAILTIAGIAWTLYGALLTGEVAELSPRACRDLPQSLFGRMFLTWFNPGSATGYIFTLTTFFALTATILGVNALAVVHQPGMAFEVDDLWPFAILLWSYMALYLGIGRLVVVGLRRVADFGLLAVLLIHVMILTAACALPTFVQFWMQNFQNADYSNLQALNWMWTLIETMTGSWMMWPVVRMVCLAGLTMFMINLVFAAREIEVTRAKTPARVLQDDEKLAAALAAE